MDRFLTMLAVSLVVALAPATRGQGPLPLALPATNPGVAELGPGYPAQAPLSGPVVPGGDPSGTIVTTQPGPAVQPGPAGNPGFFDQRGVAELAAGEYDEAIADFDEALRCDPTNPLYYYHRALANFRTGQHEPYQRALGDLFDAILRDPTRTDFYLARARVFTRLNRFDRAREDYNVVLRNEPANQEAFQEREELKLRELAYNPPAETAPDSKAGTATTPPLTPLQQAQEQAAIAEVLARIEKARLDAATYQQKRADLAKNAGQAVKKKAAAPSLATTATNENLKAQIAISRAIQAKAQAEQMQYLNAYLLLRAPKPAPEKDKAAKANPKP